MDTNLNLKGRVQIYNNDNGECVLDKHNAITDLGRDRILFRMFNNYLANGNNNMIIRTIAFGYGTTVKTIEDINGDFTKNKTIIDGYLSSNFIVEYDAENKADKLSEAETNFTKYISNVITDDNITRGPMRGSVNYELTKNTSEGTSNYNNSFIGTFADNGTSVTYIPGSAPANVCGGYYLDNNSMIIYAKISNSTTTSVPLTAISLMSTESVGYGVANGMNVDTAKAPYYAGNGNSIGISDSKKYFVPVPWTYLTFNLGELAADSTYVIKYTLYM